MSSLHQDHLLDEGPEPTTGPRATLAKARGTSPRAAEEKATSTVPTQRQGKSQRSGAAPTTAAATLRPPVRKAPSSAACCLGARAKGAVATKGPARTKA